MNPSHFHNLANDPLHLVMTIQLLAEYSDVGVCFNGK